MSATYAGVTPSLPSCNPNASWTDDRPIQLTQTDGHVTRMDGHVDNPGGFLDIDIIFFPQQNCSNSHGTTKIQIDICNFS